MKTKKAHQVDNLDRYALTTLTVSRSWSFSPQLQYLQRRYSVQVLENVPVDTIILALAINKPIDQVKYGTHLRRTAIIIIEAKKKKIHRLVRLRL